MKLFLNQLLVATIFDASLNLLSVVVNPLVSLLICSSYPLIALAALLEIEWIELVYHSLLDSLVAINFYKAFQVKAGLGAVILLGISLYTRKRSLWALVGLVSLPLNLSIDHRINSQTLYQPKNLVWNLGRATELHFRCRWLDTNDLNCRSRKPRKLALLP